jgi:hypothetical protein
MTGGQNLEECDATMANRSAKAGQQKTINIKTINPQNGKDI